MLLFHLIINYILIYLIVLPAECSILLILATWGGHIVINNKDCPRMQSEIKVLRTIGRPVITKSVNKLSVRGKNKQVQSHTSFSTHTNWCQKLRNWVIFCDMRKNVWEKFSRNALCQKNSCRYVGTNRNVSNVDSMSFSSCPACTLMISKYCVWT